MGICGWLAGWPAGGCLVGLIAWDLELLGSPPRVSCHVEAEGRGKNRVGPFEDRTGAKFL